MARRAHHLCISKANFCPTCPETRTAVVPTSFAGVVVIQLLLCALLAFQGSVVQCNIRVVPSHFSTAGQR